MSKANPYLKILVTLLIMMAIGVGVWYRMGGKSSRAPESVLSEKAQPLAATKGKDAAPAASVITITMAPVSLHAALSAVGTLEAAESADLKAEYAGQVKAIPLQEGQLVKKGDVLVELDDSIAKADLAKANAVLANMKTQFGRSEELQKKNYISKQELDQSKSGYQEALAAADSARVRYDKTKIRAPFDGIAGLRNFSVGDYIEVGRLLTTVDKIDPVKVDFMVPEKNFGDIKSGLDVTIETDAFPGKPAQGTIYAVDSRINPDTRNFHAKATATNPEGFLRSGMFARINVRLGERTGILMVPEEAIYPKGTQQFVFVVKEGKAVLTKITPGQREKGAVEVVDGLHVGDEVIIEGVIRLRDGVPVKVLDKSAGATKAANQATDQNSHPDENKP
ncbi:MAG: efflux RND transporter periplasmic adaptor subunit [Alphaproteobacteria bacterium]|nr:efflux RND transporter periplasmic adaptor subunit [Alphaproteobacteria bacterium]